MAGPRVLVVAGTHGNEVNAPWLLQQWERSAGLLESHGLDVVPVIGNPEAQRLGRRYVDRDLNRSFRPDACTSLTSCLSTSSSAAGIGPFPFHPKWCL